MNADNEFGHVALEVTFHGPPSAQELVALTASLQVAHDAISDGLGYPRTDLQVTRIQHPNSLFELLALREVAGLLAELVAAGGLVGAFVLLVPRTRAKAAKYRAERLAAEAAAAAAEEKLRRLQATEATKTELELAEVAKKRAQAEAASAKARYDAERYRRRHLSLQAEPKKVRAIERAAKAVKMLPEKAKAPAFGAAIRKTMAPSKQRREPPSVRLAEVAKKLPPPAEQTTTKGSARNA